MNKARGTTGVVVWVLSVILALIFVVFAGLPKLYGGQTFFLQAAAMHGFPSWIRVVVGVFEVIGGLALLIPGLAIYGAFGLGILMIPAVITQAMSGEPGLYVPVVLFILLAIVGWQRDPATMRGLYRGIAGASGPVVREGVIAGFIGATCVAVWFFIIDLVAGHALLTPITLGQAFFSLFRNASPSPLDALIGYTIVHYIAFAIAGIVAADVVALAGREPTVLFGFAILFVAFEVGFYGFVALLQHASPLGALAWPQVMIGNLIAATAMGIFLWRAHPQLRDQFAHALD